jgi:hypothetical protein
MEQFEGLKSEVAHMWPTAPVHGHSGEAVSVPSISDKNIKAALSKRPIDMERILPIKGPTLPKLMEELSDIKEPFEAQHHTKVQQGNKISQLDSTVAQKAQAVCQLEGTVAQEAQAVCQLESTVAPHADAISQHAEIVSELVTSIKELESLYRIGNAVEEIMGGIQDANDLLLLESTFDDEELSGALAKIRHARQKDWRYILQEDNSGDGLVARMKMRILAHILDEALKTELIIDNMRDKDHIEEAAEVLGILRDILLSRSIEVTDQETIDDADDYFYFTLRLLKKDSWRDVLNQPTMRKG